MNLHKSSGNKVKAESFNWQFEVNNLCAQTRASVPARARSWAGPLRLQQLSPQHCHPPSTWAQAAALPALKTAGHQRINRVCAANNHLRVSGCKRRSEHILPRAAREVRTRNRSMSATSETLLTGHRLPTPLLYPRDGVCVGKGV